VTLSPKTLSRLHSLAVGIGTSVASFLMGTFASGLPSTKAAWHAVGMGIAGAALSRVFGWLLGLIQETPTP
jgi:hypothetical protein